MSTHHDECHKYLTLPVMGLGAAILIISLIGFLGALKDLPILLWIYLLILCLILVGILVVTALLFIVTSNGSGHYVSGQRYKEFKLQDYSSWYQKQLNNSQNWRRLKSCLVKSEDCKTLPKLYKTLKEYKNAELSPIEAGCCRPPSECGYPAINASYYDLSFHPVSGNRDCKLYKNSPSIKCYNCDSCKAGVAQHLRTEWRLVAIFDVILFVVLSALYFVGCCARRSAARARSAKARR
ncbi:tetraspanin-10 isoform X3 [Amborella trichopoda]|nr:tetraspanin-10 isoform X3 [Amborella trichopoda]XP_020527483.1 tetraspanin-10 isoform X3 [Amborella trichopoda]|eukprot:XP_020527477.1 tetraspanin-10 isoform X3 [Amborella trichopoda]